MAQNRSWRAAKTTVLTVLEYGLVVAIGFLISSLPVDMASALMGRLWRWIAPLTARQSRVLVHLKAAFPELTAAETAALSRDMWEHIGRTAAESFHIDALLKDPSRISICEPETASTPYQSGEGLILVSLHCGNWELLGPVAGREGIPIEAVYQPLRNALVERYLLGLRQPFYPRGLWPKGHEMARAFMKTVRCKEPVAMVADQRDLRGVDVTFFGRPATATPFPAMLARANKVPIVIGMMRRLPAKKVRFELSLVRLDPRVSENKRADVQQITQDIHGVFEMFIRHSPEQYMWAHQKWRQADNVRRRYTTGQAARAPEDYVTEN